MILYTDNFDESEEYLLLQDISKLVNLTYGKLILKNTELIFI